ncbi:MAG: ThuA domain-containing protein [Planctomycetota bacterium]|jgi:type 1 glutamine amidotransferase
MLYFFADNHYDSRPGYELYSRIQDEFDITFYEDDFSKMEDASLLEDCELLILNMIGTTCNLPHPSAKAETVIKGYVESGKNLALMHGSSAAFWEWSWWREMVGVRWVRGNDPDGVEASTHPVEPYRVDLCKCRHPLMKELKAMDLAEDEIYINMEQVCPTQTLMQNVMADGSHPQLTWHRNAWGGEVINFMPGHRPTTFENPDYLHNAKAIIHYLTR